MNLKDKIPSSAVTILATLERAGYEAYLVGGAVRDLVLGREPSDYDITTNALPDETQAVFADCATLEIGKAHGTIGVIMNHDIYEVTTYRVDGEYTDSRHPDQVRFTRSIEEDLKRRDFTINAMAMDLRGNITEVENASRDLERHQICAVGDPTKRFQEDALRILRGLRFASQLDFTLEESTGQAIRENGYRLLEIAPERIQQEMNKLLCGKNPIPSLREYRDVMGVIIPELKASFDFDQRNPFHCYDVYEHSLHVVSQVPATVVLRWAALLHDVGKPSCFTVKENWGHFYGHEQVSGEIAQRILERLRYDRKTIRQVTELIDCHGYVFNRTEKYARRRLNQLGEEQLKNLIALERGDVLSQAEDVREERARKIQDFAELADQVIQQEGVMKRRDMKISGRELLEMGVPEGPEVGRILGELFEQVLDGTLPNEREILRQKGMEYILQKEYSREKATEEVGI